MMKEFPTESDSEADKFFRTFTRDVVAERKALFLENCNRGHRYETYMCRGVWRKAWKEISGPKPRHVDPRKVDLYAKFYANAVAAPLKHRINIFIGSSIAAPIFNSRFRMPTAILRKSATRPCAAMTMIKACDQFTLESFLSDDNAIVALFKNEVAQCSLP